MIKGCGVEGIVGKMKEGRLRRYGHVKVIRKNKEEMVRDMEWRD